MTTPPTQSGIESAQERRFGGFTFIALGLFFTYVSYRVIGGYLFLIYTYGFSRVFSEHLHLVRMHKAEPWIVSNGDQIQGGGFLWWLLVTGIFFALFIPTFLLITRFLPRKKEQDAG